MFAVVLLYWCENVVVGAFNSHGFSFPHNYLGDGEYRRVGLPRLTMQPYARMVVLHLAIISGGFFVLALGSPVAALALLIVLETAIDLGAHLAERRKHGSLPPGQALFATTSS